MVDTVVTVVAGRTVVTVGGFALLGPQVAAGQAAQAAAEEARDEAREARDDAAQSAGDAVAMSGTVPRVNKTAMAALNTTTSPYAYLTTPVGQEGWFRWDADIGAAEHQADADKLDLVHLTAGAGAAGAFRRVEKYGSVDLKGTVGSLIQKWAGGNVVLFRARSSGAVHEWHAFGQQGIGSPEWTRWIFSNHANALGVGTGALRMCLATHARLPRKVRHPRPPANDTPGALWSLGEMVFIPQSSGAYTGSFTVSAFDGMDTKYSLTTADYVDYTAAGYARLIAIGRLVSNGGIASAVVKTGGVEIASGYIPALTGSERLLSYTPGARWTSFPLADVSPNLAYTIRKEVDSTNPATMRMYQAGLWGVRAGWQTRAGLYGMFSELSIGGRSTIFAEQNGEAIVVECRDCTGMIWETVKTSTGGIVRLDVYNAAGEVVYTETVDTYAASSAVYDHPITGLPRADYWCHPTATGTKHASSADTRMHHHAVVAVNELVCGDPENDTFDILDGSPLATSTAGGSDYIGYDVTIERVLAISKPGGSSGGFVGGSHGHETLGTPVWRVGGEVVAFAAGAAGDRWVGYATDIECVYTTDLLFPISAWTAANAVFVGDYRTNDSGKVYVCTTAGTTAGSGGPTGLSTGITDGTAVWNYLDSELIAGTAEYTQRVSSAGYEAEIIDTLSEDVKLYNIYDFMHQFPSNTQRITVASSASFSVGQAVSGGTSGSTGTVARVLNSTTMFLRLTGQQTRFSVGETLTGPGGSTTIGTHVNDAMTSGVGGGFGNVLIEPRGPFEFTAAVNEQTLPVPADAIAAWNADYVAAGWPLNAAGVAAALAGLGLQTGSRLSFLADNVNNASPTLRDKYYQQPFRKVSGVVIPAATTWRVHNFWAAGKVRDFGRLLL